MMWWWCKGRKVCLFSCGQNNVWCESLLEGIETLFIKHHRYHRVYCLSQQVLSPFWVIRVSPLIRQFKEFIECPPFQKISMEANKNERAPIVISFHPSLCTQQTGTPYSSSSIPQSTALHSQRVHFIEALQQCLPPKR